MDGEVTADSWVMDFGELRAMVVKMCDRLNHGVLVPTENEHLEIERIEGHYEVTIGGRRYVMPEGDVRPLPIDNCTAERLAEWLAGQLAGQLHARGGANLSCLTVTVEEAPGQSASFTLSLDSDSPGNE